MIELQNIATGKKILIKKVFCNDVKNPTACYIKDGLEKYEALKNNGGYYLQSERAGYLWYYGGVIKKINNKKVELISFSIKPGWKIIGETATKIKMR